ncbi:hypothetical protein [Actinomadura rubrisoli]|uniref:Uncharacterized protein n=1 Tax=Actinomadura rubrisoli TaxID=2530368 RepID=A0A4R5C183_9ACTN|nr:hypothetical protein [Actinomadura rubrisoli]TDD92505.1 hypothetical protein E1298_10835 [Actinomadura rubrisoli]
MTKPPAAGPITIDFDELAKAAPEVADLHHVLARASARLAGLDVGADMPPDVGARVRAAVHAAAAETGRAAARVDGLDRGMASCARFAQIANGIALGAKIAEPLKYQLEVIGLSKWVTGLKVFGYAAEVPSLISDLSNPYLGTDRKVARGAVRVTAVAGADVGGAKAAQALGAAAGRRAAARELERGGTRLAARAAAKLVSGRVVMLAGGPAGITLGLAWTIADAKFNLTPKVADGALWTAGKVGDAAGEVAKGADKATPWDGVAPW